MCVRKRKAQAALPYACFSQLADGGGKHLLGWKKDAVRMMSVCHTNLLGESLSFLNCADELGRHIFLGTRVKKSCSVK